MVDSAQKDIEAIEELHRQDVAATKAQQYEHLKSLMDPLQGFPPVGVGGE